MSLERGVPSSGSTDKHGTITGQGHEDDMAEMVVVCSPSLSKMMGALHPAGALYEKPVNLELTKNAHSEFVELLRRRGVMVEDVREILGRDADWNVGARIALEGLAERCLKYEYKGASLNGYESAFYVGDEYKKSVIEAMDIEQLVDIVLTNPTVTVKESLRDTGFTASYRFEPLSNIIFVRDQQVTTRKGIVMARLRSPQRHNEVDVMEFCLRKLGLNVIARIPEPGHLEGGDFFPAGEDLCFVGVGSRSDMVAVEYMLENDLFGTRRVAVVHDRFEAIQERMHLDTVFNILSRNCVLMLKDMMGSDSPTRRTVDEYVYNPSGLPVYKKLRTDIEFSDYVRSEGYHIIEIEGTRQLKYGCNILNLGNANIVSIEKYTARQIALSKYFEGTVEYLDFSAVTAMYGGVHCASQVVQRRVKDTDELHTTKSLQTDQP